MSRYMEDLKEMLCDELDKIAEQGELTAGSLDTIQKLTHSIKSIETIMAMENGGYSNDYERSYDWAYTDGYSRARGGRNTARRNSEGRYSRNTRRGYSGDDAKDHMIERLEDMMEEAKDSKTKEAIKKAIHQIGE